MQRVDSSTISNGRKVTNSHSVQFSANGNVVPDSCPLADDNIADEAGVGSNPSVVNLGFLVVDGHHLAVTG